MRDDHHRSLTGERADGGCDQLPQLGIARHDPRRIAGRQTGSGAFLAEPAQQSRDKRFSPLGVGDERRIEISPFGCLRDDLAVHVPEAEPCRDRAADELAAGTRRMGDADRSTCRLGHRGDPTTTSRARQRRQGR